jgi:uncharacterized repeat protein (TIGR03847 family)
MGVFYEFDEVDSFTVGAMGQPGQRTFYLQARRGPTRVSIKCEKQQASAISEYLRKVLSDLPVPADTPRPVAMDLAAPFDAAFVLGPIGLGYDRENDRVLVQMEEVVPVDEDGESDPELAADRGHVRVFLTRGQAHAFCEHADVVVAAGRPPCTWCGLPLDPEGHACPRMN